MTIDEAIELLSHCVGYNTILYRGEGHDAIKLGIEALKMVKGQRNIDTYTCNNHLPGETELQGGNDNAKTD